MICACVMPVTYGLSILEGSVQGLNSTTGDAELSPLKLIDVT